MSKMKFLVFALGLVLAIPTIAGAIQTNSIEVTKDINQDTATQLRDAGSPAAVDSITDLVTRYMTNFRTCEPVHLTQTVDIFGFKFSYQFDINGWVDNKCSYYATANIGGLGNDIRDVFQIQATDEMIAKVKPVIQCNFTREQLDILVDGFIATQERKVSEKIGLAEDKTPTGKPKLSPAEEKMMQMLTTSGACTIPNQEELMKNFTELMGTFQSTTLSSPEVSVPAAPEQKVEPVTPEAEPVQKPTLRQDGPKVNMPSAPSF